MRALVTGGAGFIGSHLVDGLIAQGHHVDVADYSYSTHPPALKDWAERYADWDGMMFHAIDLTARLPIRQLMKRGKYDVVFHLAGHASVRGGAQDPRRPIDNNLTATMNVLEAMRQANVRTIVFSSTAAVYGDLSSPLLYDGGDAQPVPIPEDAPFPVQTSLYGASKAAAEGLISAYAHTFGLTAVIVRFVPLLGERYVRGHVYDLYRKLRTWPYDIEVLGTGKQRKAHVYVRDAVQGVLTALCATSSTVPVHVYNVSSDEVSTVDDSLDVICEELGVNPKRTYTMQPGWSGDVDRVLDWGRLKRLGWSPTVGTKEAVLRTVRSFRG